MRRSRRDSVNSLSPHIRTSDGWTCGASPTGNSSSSFPRHELRLPAGPPITQILSTNGDTVTKRGRLIGHPCTTSTEMASLMASNSICTTSPCHQRMQVGSEWYLAMSLMSIPSIIYSEGYSQKDPWKGQLGRTR